MSQGTEHFFEVVEVLFAVGLIFFTLPSLMNYWTKPLVTYADDKTALDAVGTLEDLEVEGGHIQDAILLCVTSVDDGCKPGRVKFAVGTESAVLDLNNAVSWELDRISTAKKIWSNAKEVVKEPGDSNAAVIEKASHLVYKKISYQPGISRLTGDKINSDEGLWVISLGGYE